MAFKVDTRKRVKISQDILWKIKREYYSDILWFETFVSQLAFECGLLKTSVVGMNNYRKAWFSSKVRPVYYFKILDKNKYMLAKIKYGI